MGTHETLLAYLVRRLLENGANTSFVHQLVDDKIPIEELIADPVAEAERLGGAPHPSIVLPGEMFGAERKNSKGLDLSDDDARSELERAIAESHRTTYDAGPILAAPVQEGQEKRAIRNPSRPSDIVGRATALGLNDVETATASAAAAAARWANTSASERAALLERGADLIEKSRKPLIALLVREAGKTMPNAISEVREAADYCRYYAAQARRELAGAHTPLSRLWRFEPLTRRPAKPAATLSRKGRGLFRASLLPSASARGCGFMDRQSRQGEIARKKDRMRGRSVGKASKLCLGPAVCISPWNFPLAIFTGQIAAALAAGNPVVAKPAEQTPLIAAETVRLLHEAGIPRDVLQLVPGPGSSIGAALVADPRVQAVVFTGSSEVARSIQHSLAQRGNIPLIAETGGQNAMIVDSSALPEQVVADVLASAFNSAGQRCSALRVLCLQEDIADRVLHMLKGAMAELRVGDQARIETDVGPVIDAGAQAALMSYTEAHKDRILFQTPLAASCAAGSFVAPTLLRIGCIGELTHEVFGPILHVVRFASHDLPRLIDDINKTGYGLTLGVHSRIDETVDFIVSRARAGNIYVNRTVIGAVVGVQPFGGEGLSGTGPKAGGPLYIRRLLRDAPRVQLPGVRDETKLEALGDARRMGAGRRKRAFDRGRKGTARLNPSKATARRRLTPSRCVCRVQLGRTTRSAFCRAERSWRSRPRYRKPCASQRRRSPPATAFS